MLGQLEASVHSQGGFPLTHLHPGAPCPPPPHMAVDTSQTSELHLRTQESGMWELRASLDPATKVPCVASTAFCGSGKLLRQTDSEGYKLNCTSLCKEQNVMGHK